MPRSNKTNKPMYSDADKIRTTVEAPRVQDTHPSQSQMSLEEFMRRNPSARSKDRIKTAQTDQGKRRGPKMRDTARSLRGGTAKVVKRAPPKKPDITELARRVEKAIEMDDLMEMPIEDLLKQ